MKNVFYTFLTILLLQSNTFAQVMYPMSFEAGDTVGYTGGVVPRDQLFIDTISNPDNIWQVGKPNKAVFTSAFSVPNVIVTDTINPYPVNDTSFFIIKNVANYGYFFHYQVSLSGMYFVNSDTLTDYGKIEYSPDNGVSWIDLINDTVYDSFIFWNPPKPVLTGNSGGWKPFYFNITQLGTALNVQFGDTVLFRFSFISDGNQTNKDGLMFDDFIYVDIVEAIKENGAFSVLSLNPNPASERITVSFPLQQSDTDIIVFNSLGEQVLKTNVHRAESEVRIDVAHLPAGLYFVKMNNYSGKFVKE